MPFDGVVTKCVVEELSDFLAGGRIDRIYQPALNEVVISIRSKGSTYRLLASANPSCPRIHMTGDVKKNPKSPPMFCMLLRKHLLGGSITGFVFNDYERVVDMNVETINEMGDLAIKVLVVEIMGKHSNIILLDEKKRIIDSIKHVDEETSSLREVMPARPYTRPPAQDKKSPEILDIGNLLEKSSSVGKSIQNFLLDSIRGFSPFICKHICTMADVNGKKPCDALSAENISRLEASLSSVIDAMKNSDFHPWMLLDNDTKPLDFHCIRPVSTENTVFYDSISETLDVFYSQRDRLNSLNQKRNSLLRKVRSALRRCERKQSIQQADIWETADFEKLRLYGELLTANIHSIQPHAEEVSVHDYYSTDNSHIKIALDKNLSPQENAQLYYKRYARTKRKYAYAGSHLRRTLKEIEYLENVIHHLESCETPRELTEVCQELIEQGIIKKLKREEQKRDDIPSAPYHYRSSDGFDILAGRNNKQNDMLTLKKSSPDDTWLHTRNIPGSHVIVKNSGRKLPDRTLEEAAVICAVHSKARLSRKVPVDYTTVKYVRKPKGLQPGLVLYDNFKTLVVDPDMSLAKKLAYGNER